MPFKCRVELYGSVFFLPIWLYLDAEVLVLPPVFYPQDSCFVGRRLFVVNQLPPTRSRFRLLCWCGLSMRGVSVIPRAVSLRVSISQSTGRYARLCDRLVFGILGIPLPALMSNILLELLDLPSHYLTDTRIGGSPDVLYDVIHLFRSSSRPPKVNTLKVLCAPK